jgi:hypothetical protein
VHELERVRQVLELWLERTRGHPHRDGALHHVEGQQDVHYGQLRSPGLFGRWPRVFQ